MPLSWNDIRERSHAFATEWANETAERAESQSFWNAFFEIFGITRRRVASFDRPTLRAKGSTGFIDLFWKGVLIAEHKSRGANLDKAYDQALDYFTGLKERDLPRWVIVSDFARFRLYDLDRDERHEFALSDLPRQIKRFGFIAGYQVQAIRPQDPVNIQAAERMGALHDLLEESGYENHPLEVLLVRLLFCMFADGTGIFQPAQSFREWLEGRTAEDGSDLGPQLAQFFQVLNTPTERRAKTLDEQLASFPYVNGKLFEEVLPIASFDRAMRESLLNACTLDWGKISPAIFGALFQSIMDDRARRDLGAHYTSEGNILKLLRPLFLDDLRGEFERVKSNRSQLIEFHRRLRSLTFLDPACGCGNFLAIAYRELRELELEILRATRTPGQQILDVHTLIRLDVDQFYGIEIEEFPAQIAQVALWLTDHQMNQKVGDEFGIYYARIPLRSTPHIVHGNALQLEWDHVVPIEQLTYIFGNPPFIGKQHQSVQQKLDLAAVAAKIPNARVLDYVAAWYLKAVPLVRASSIRCAFVSTSSITQGEQVGVLWSDLLRRGIKIQFAHRTFRWTNEARGMAAVHCVIIGFGGLEVPRKMLFEYETPDGEPHGVQAANINPYLVDAPDVLLESRQVPLSPVPRMDFGSMPNDGGHLLLEDAEKAELLAKEPGAARWIRPFLGAEEFLNGTKRWCLWLVDIEPHELRALPEVSHRVAAVKATRLASAREGTRRRADFPGLFAEIRQPQSQYLLVPRHSSENRAVIPMGLLPAEVIAGDHNLIIPDASLFHLGVLSSAMHMSWVNAVCGRLESRYRYSKDIVYNNFPWPVDATPEQKEKIAHAAQDMVDARSAFATSSLADLYDPTAMPAALVKAHKALDRAVDVAYGTRKFASASERVAFLFGRHQRLSSLLPMPPTQTRRRR
jgi:hypothetical protein